MNYTTLSLADVRTALEDIARDTQAIFGGLDARQLNWKPGAAQWSVAQCFEHLLASNRLMFLASEDALKGARRTVWQRLPFLPGLFGRMLIRSQTPEAQRKFTASPKAQPVTSDIPADVIARFVDQQREAVKRVDALDERQAARTVMTSPFVNVITYTVLDGWRLIVAHDRRHFEQARRVTQSAGFPSA